MSFPLDFPCKLIVSRRNDGSDRYLKRRCDAVTAVAQSTEYYHICDELLALVDTDASYVHECGKIGEY